MNRKNMLVETVRERRGETFAAVDGDVIVNGEPSLDVVYRRIPNRVPVGVFVGINDHGCVRVGWSKCKLPPDHIPAHILNRFRPEEKQAHLHAMKDSDRFNLDRGITEAVRKIHDHIAPPVHRGFARRFDQFKIRCERYFKDAAFIDDSLVNGKFRRLPPRNVGAAPELNALMNMLATIMGGGNDPLSLMVPGRLFGSLPRNQSANLLAKLPRNQSANLLAKLPRNQSANLLANLMPLPDSYKGLAEMFAKVLTPKGTIAERKARGEGPHGVLCKCPW